MRPRVHRAPQRVRHRVVRFAEKPVLPLLPGQFVFRLRLADVQAVFVDKRLHHGIDEHGNIQPAIDIVANARGADGLVKRRERQHAQLAADDGRERLPRRLRLFAAAENDVVILRRRAGLAASVGGRAADHVAARHKIQLPLRQEAFQKRQIARHGDVDGNIVREQIRVPLVGGGDHGDLPPQELGQRLLAPREFVDGQIHLKAQRADLLHDLLVPGGKRVERAGEERRGLRRGERERALLNIVLHDEAVEMVEHRRVVKAHGLPRARLAQKRQQLFVQPRKQRSAEGKRQRVACEQVAAEHLHRRLVHVRVIVAHAGHQVAEQAADDGAVRLPQRGDHRADGGQRHARRARRRAVRHFFKRVDSLQQLLFRQQADELPDVGRDEAGDLLLAGLELTQQVAGDLVDLVGRQVRRDEQQVPPRRLTHRQMLRHAQKIRKMQRRVEYVPPARHRVGAQKVDLRELHGPVDGVFEVAEVERRDLMLAERRRAHAAEQRAQIVRRRLAALRQALRQLVHGSPARRLLPQVQQQLHRDQAAVRLARLRHGAQRLQKLPARRVRQVRARHVAQRVRQGEALRVLRRFQLLQQRREQPRRALRRGGGKQALADRFDGIRDAQRVPRGVFAVGVQAGVQIIGPQLRRLVQKRRGRRGRRAVGSVLRALLAVARAAVGQHLAHRLSRHAAHVAVRVRQQLV